MRTQDVKIHEGFGNAQMPYMMRLTHLPTGATVEGNCRNEDSKPNLQTTLWAALQKAVNDAGPDPVESVAGDEHLQSENIYLRDQLSRMQAQIDALSREKPKAERKPAKAKGRKMTAAQRKAVGERLRRGREAKAAQAEPEPELSVMLAQQMRPPTDAPVALPKAHQSKGGVVVKVSDEARAKGFLP